MHLAEHQRPSPEKIFEIQLLDDCGRATSCVYFGESRNDSSAADRRIPSAVVDAARLHAIGKGDYVDGDGKTVRPF